MVIFLALTLVALTVSQPLGSLYFATETAPGTLGIVAVNLTPPHTQRTVVTLPTGLALEGARASTAPIYCDDYPEKEFHCIAVSFSRPGPPKNPWVPAEAGCVPTCIGIGSAKCCRDPAMSTKSSIGKCFQIAQCSDINDGHGMPTGVTFLINVKTQKILVSRPSPICWSLAIPVFQSGVLCVEQEPCIPDPKVPCGNNVVKSIDLSADPQPDVTVAVLPKKLVADFPIAAYIGAGGAGALNYTEFYHIGLNDYATKRDRFFTLNVTSGKVRETPFGDGKSKPWIIHGHVCVQESEGEKA
jgi:hypothetical protein